MPLQLARYEQNVVASVYERLDPTVKTYTGYIDIEARHIFFYFFESRNDPDKDDVIFWTNGGPGCSSSLVLYMELGMSHSTPRALNTKTPTKDLAGFRRLVPKDGNGTSFHPESWNINSNIFFVDQPIGVGFSYADYGETVGTTEEDAKDIAAFVFIFFEHFSKFKGRAFHMAGESYGGRYVPVFAAEVYDQNARLAAAGYTPINLSSVMIGNGITDFYHQTSSLFYMQCTPASLPPTLSIAECVRMKSMIPHCEQRLKESCVDLFDAIDCAAAVSFCEDHFRTPFWKSGLNPYDLSKSCSLEALEVDFCYPITADIRAYLSRPDVRTVLGVDPAVPANFSSCSLSVTAAFYAQLDVLRRTSDHIGALLEHGVRVLIYAGTYDWICNWVGNERWTLALEWSGQAEFNAEPLRPWAVGGDFAQGRAGLARGARGLTFATVDKAGHMVPYDKPKEALDLLQRWLSGDGF
ncbi:Alpha/Beta hydrolase protein [Mycena metata]|uniref:Carboxypeptidase n=1 Tax=Mycena metata TaxID=1033252 RepID=A0AAD7NDX6_9AGAR|nr:Alpha/Beta hydrolase protein [Mycena metata]